MCLIRLLSKRTAIQTLVCRMQRVNTIAQTRSSTLKLTTDKFEDIICNGVNTLERTLSHWTMNVMKMKDNCAFDGWLLHIYSRNIHFCYRNSKLEPSHELFEENPWAANSHERSTGVNTYRGSPNSFRGYERVLQLVNFWKQT